MSRKKILVVGFDEEGEKMYPHTYDWLKLLRDHHDVTYYGGDDKGFNLYLKDGELSKINKLLNRSKYKKTEQWYDERINKISTEIKNLFSHDYDTVIAMDHSALYHTCKFINKKKSKLIFWSYDIITCDHFWYIKAPSIRNMIEENRKTINMVDHIIVQDYFRGAVLDSSVFSHQIPKTYIPVSLLSDEFSESTAKKKTENHFTNQKPVLMQVGAINAARFSDELIKILQKKHTEFGLKLLGFPSKEIYEFNEHIKYKPELLTPRDSLKEMRETISTAEIGIVGLNECNLNNLFYSKASGQAVEFLRMGIPLIVIGHKEAGTFFEKCKSGIYIEDCSALLVVIEKIKSSYRSYSQDSYTLFNKEFNLTNYSNDLLYVI